MDARVTPRSIAYIAVLVRRFLHVLAQLIYPFQLHFSLTDATYWMSEYNGFNYEEFWEFIVDYFEADETPQGQEASTKLLEWWNECVQDFIFISVVTNKYSQASFPEVSSHTCSGPNISTTCVPCDPTTTVSSSPLISTTLLVTSSTPSTHLFKINITVKSWLFEVRSTKPVYMGPHSCGFQLG